MTTMKRIGCRIVNGVKLRLFKDGYDDGTGKCPIVADGDAVTLAGPSARQAGTTAPGYGQMCVTLVSDEWWQRWMAQNKGKNPLFDLGHIFDIDATESRETDDGNDASGHV